MKAAHMRKRDCLKPMLCGLAAVLVLGGCIGPTGERPRFPKPGDITAAVREWFKDDPLSDSDPTAANLYKDGMDYFERERYARSISFFEKLRDEHPFSKEAETAELKIAEAYYLNGEYAQAEETYKNYLAFQPTGRHTHYVKYQLGRVNMDQFTGMDRDLVKVREAKGHFESVIQDHPDSEHAADAREKLEEARVHLAERELYVGEFYMGEESYWAARERFENVLRDYPDTPAAPRALFGLAEAHRRGNDPAKALAAYRRLMENHPRDPLAERARSEAARLSASPPESPAAPDPPAAAKPAGQAAPETPLLITKEGYDYEDPDGKSWYEYLNPFSWGGDGEESEEVAASRAGGEGQAPAEESRGFFSFLNPFSWGGGESEGAAGKPDPAETASSPSRAVVERIDETLGTPERRSLEPPASDLPEDPEAKVPVGDPAAVLGEVDAGLGQGGPEAGAPPAPAADPALFSARKPQPAREEGGDAEARSGLLETIDRQLREEGVGKPRELPTPPAGP